MKIAMIDNYDSFTYNLVHLVKELGAEVTVFRNDQFALSDLESFDKIMLSPGPGIPSEAGLLLDVIRTYAGEKPILGICLGEQAIGEAFGANLVNLDEVFHGVQTPAHIVDFVEMPDCLEVTCTSNEGQVMALRHREYDVRGIQFHPESVLTPDGKKIINNWLLHL